MKFASWNLLYHLCRSRKAFGADELKVSDWYAHRADDLHQYVRLRGLIERDWLAERSPFYNVYPVVAEPLLRVNLDLESRWLTYPVNPILIRFAEPMVTGGHRLSAMLIQLTEDRLKLVTQTPDMIDAELPACALVQVDISQQGTLEEIFTNTGRTSAVSEGDEHMFRAAMRVAAGVALLARDSDIVEPELLAADQGKPLSQRLIDKANKRGVRGWSIGKSLATGPHLRKPHFAIRWMGKGRVDPRLRPVKGSLVNKHVVAKVPTGFLSEDPPTH